MVNVIVIGIIYAARGTNVVLLGCPVEHIARDVVEHQRAIEPIHTKFGIKFSDFISKFNTLALGHYLNPLCVVYILPYNV